MEFLCLYCQPEWSSARIKDSVNLLTQIKSSMLFIEMKKVFSALFHLELWDILRQPGLLLCSTFVSISPHGLLLLEVGKAFSVTSVKENLVNACFVTAFCSVRWALPAVCFLSTPSTLSTENHGPRYYCWGEMDTKKTSPPKGSCEGDQLGDRLEDSCYQDFEISDIVYWVTPTIRKVILLAKQLFCVYKYCLVSASKRGP